MSSKERTNRKIVRKSEIKTLIQKNESISSMKVRKKGKRSSKSVMVFLHNFLTAYHISTFILSCFSFLLSRNSNVNVFLLLLNLPFYSIKNSTIHLISI